MNGGTLNDIKLFFQKNGYELISQIGTGGYSKVYTALSLKYQIVFAIKVIFFEGKEEAINICKMETAAIKDLDHPNVIKIYDEFYNIKYGGIVMEYCPNGSLQDHINQKGKLLGSELLRISQSIVSAVNYCHSKQIAHCDIKPCNILMDSHFRPQLSDFGISMRLASKLFPATDLDMCNYLCPIMQGTLAFLAPEVINNKTSCNPFAADAWALGVTLYFAAVGKLPWHSHTKNDLLKEIKCGSINYREIKNALTSSEWLLLIIKGLLNPDPAQRMTVSIAFQERENHLPSLPQKAIVTASLSKEVLPRVFWNAGRNLSSTNFSCIKRRISK